MKLHIVNSSHSYEKLFLSLGYDLVDGVEKADILCFTGGSDVDPSFYGHKKHNLSSVDVERDEKDFDAFQEGRFRDLPMIGICRGAQFLHVMNGGYLFQDVEGHTKDHLVYTTFIPKSGKSEFNVTSTHHQMMSRADRGKIDSPYPKNRCSVLAYDPRDSRVVFFDKVHKRFSTTSIYDTSEVLWWSGTRCLCFQPHPEFEDSTNTKELFVECLNQYKLK